MFLNVPVVFQIGIVQRIGEADFGFMKITGQKLDGRVFYRLEVVGAGQLVQSAVHRIQQIANRNVQFTPANSQGVVRIESELQFRQRFCLAKSLLGLLYVEVLLLDGQVVCYAGLYVGFEDGRILGGSV